MAREFQKLIQAQIWIAAFLGWIPIMAQSQITWNAPMSIAASHYGNYHPRIVTNREGNPLILWGKPNDVMFSRWDGSAFTTPVKLNPANTPAATADWMGPEIAAHGDTVFVVYKQTPENINSSRIWCMRSIDGGQTFDAPVAVDNIGTDMSRFPAVTTDDDGHPVIAFMKFNPSFLDARWVVTRSFDYGATFTADVLASGWSGPASDVCDCCPGSIHASGNFVSVIYRDNNENLRDSWAGVSTDGGITFNGGINVDQHGWMIDACPASGPDGVIVGDTLYSTFMNGQSGKAIVYYNKTPLNDLSNPPATSVPGAGAGLQQNYARIDAAGDAVAVLWRNTANFATGLGLLFTEDFRNGFPQAFDTVAFTNVRNGDVALSSNGIFVAWQDNSTGAVSFRSGSYGETVGTGPTPAFASIEIYPNPSSSEWQIKGIELFQNVNIAVSDIHGKIVYSEKNIPAEKTQDYFISNTAWPGGIYIIQITSGTQFTCFKAEKI